MLEEAKHPYILSTDQHVSMLIAMHVHRKSSLTVHSEEEVLDHRYHNSVVRKIIKCGFCIRYNGRAVDKRWQIL